MKTDEFIAFCRYPTSRADDLVWFGRHLSVIDFFAICAEHVLDPATFKRIMEARGLEPNFWFEQLFCSSRPFETCVALTERSRRRPVCHLDVMLRYGTTDMVAKLNHIVSQSSMAMSRHTATRGTRHAQRDVRDMFVPLRGAVAVCLLDVPPRVKWRVWSA